MDRNKKITAEINKELNCLSDRGYATGEYNCLVMNINTYNQLVQELAEQYGLSLPIFLTHLLGRELRIDNSVESFIFVKNSTLNKVDKESQTTMFVMLAR